MSTDGPSTFLVEFPSGESINQFSTTTVSVHADPDGAIIQSIQTGEGIEGNYWTAWGGGYADLPADPFFSVFIDGVFLFRVDTYDDLKKFSYSSLVVGNQVFINIPKYLWQYTDIVTRLELLSGYSSNVRNPQNRSDDTYDGVRYPVRMAVPSVALRLSNSAFGVNLAPSFSIRLNNSDGLFDSKQSSSILNSPLTVLRSTSQPAEKSTFKKIRVGEIENVNLSPNEFNLQIADIIRTLDDPVTRTCTEAGLAENTKELPVAYGTVKVSVIELEKVENGTVTTTTFATCDPLYFTDLVSVHDTDGKTVPFSAITDQNSNGTFTFTEDSDIETAWGSPAYCIIKGASGNRLGDIIIKEVTTKTKIVYTSTFWNIPEVETYADNSPKIAIVITSGTVRSMISRLLQSDLAFFIQQNNGQLTIRKWSKRYSYHSFDSWIITQDPSRDFSDQKYYCSSAIVTYNGSAGTAKTVLDDSKESKIVAQWKKKTRSTFETDLINSSQATVYAAELIQRFGNRSEIWNVGISKSTETVELLDSVELQIAVNGRVMTAVTQWKVIGINPAQDVLTLEEDTFATPDYTDRTLQPLSHPLSIYENGYLSHTQNENESGILSMSAVNK